VFFQDHVAAGGVELVALRIGTLLFGGDPGVADPAAWSRRYMGFRLYHVRCRVTEMVIRPSEHFQALSWDPIAKKVS
jgi:hypothetical protein